MIAQSRSLDSTKMTPGGSSVGAVAKKYSKSRVTMPSPVLLLPPNVYEKTSNVAKYAYPSPPKPRKHNPKGGSHLPPSNCLNYFTSLISAVLCAADLATKRAEREKRELVVRNLWLRRENQKRRLQVCFPYRILIHRGLLENDFSRRPLGLL